VKTKKVFRLKKGGRVVYPFPWQFKNLERPWDAAHMRVMIPYTAAEMRTRNDHRRCHTQIVRRDSIEVVREVRFGV
jgi:hypothetical protein